MFCVVSIGMALLLSSLSTLALRVHRPLVTCSDCVRSTVKCAYRYKQPTGSSYRLFTTTTDNSNDSNNENNKLSERVWNIKGLKNEANRLYLRTFKKLGKANANLAIGLKEYNEILTMKDPPLDRLENCPNPETLRAEFDELQNRLAALKELEELAQQVKSSKDSKYFTLIEKAIALNVSDTPPPKQPRGPPKQKAVSTGPRMPYFTYDSADGIEIRVGRRAEDNDELSCNPKYRDNNEWWLHASGYAGSHVVIRSTDDDLPEKFATTVSDAALLAAVNSKAPQKGRVPVNLTRCRYVSKPSGAKPGLVFLRGEVTTVHVNIPKEQERLEKLQESKR